MTADEKPKVRLARNVPEPPTITDEERKALVREAKAWREEIAVKTAAIEAVTSDDLRVRAR